MGPTILLNMVSLQQFAASGFTWAHQTPSNTFLKKEWVPAQPARLWDLHSASIQGVPV